MKLVFKTKQLLEKIKNIVPTAEAKQTLVILGNVKVTINNNEALFLASDLEVQTSTIVPCSSDSSGSFTIPAKKLLEICSALSAYDEISLFYDGKKVDITAGKSKVSLQTLDASDYPDMTISDKSSSIEISQAELSKIISKTSFAMAYQDARHFLNGLYICTDKETLVAVCTDGHRLAKYTSTIKTESNVAIIIPRKAIAELNKQILKNSLNIISKVVNQQYKGVKVTPSANSLHLISSNTESEVGEDLIDAHYDGDEISIGFNISYLQDVIDAIDGDTIHICINDQNSGCILLDAKSNESTYVIMPMRV